MRFLTPGTARSPGAADARRRTLVRMSEPAPGPHEIIHLGGEAAAVVPLDEYRLLKALKDRATAEEIEEAEFDAAIAEHEVWEAAGRPGVKSHEEFMAKLFGDAR
jgi:hypothetical protein